MRSTGFRPRFRKLLHDLWENKARTMLVVLSVAVGVFAVGMITGTYSIVAQDLNDSYAGANPANIELITTPFDKDYLSTLERLPGVRQVEGRRQITVRLRNPGGDWGVLNLVAIPDFEKSEINQLLTKAGASAPRDQEVIIEQKTAEALNLKTGDWLEIELNGGTMKQVQIAGIAIDRTIGYGAFLSERLGFITTDTIEWLGEEFYLDRLVLTTSEQNDLTAIEAVAVGVRDHIEKGGREVYRSNFSQTNKHPLDSIVKALLGVLLILGILVVFLSGSLIANTLTALLGQQIAQIGVMKLVGARGFQINTLYIALILSFSAIALIIAIPLGSIAAVATADKVADLLNVVLKEHFIIPLAIVSQVIIAIGVPLLAGIWPVIRGSRVTVQRAFSGTISAESNIRKHWFDRYLEKIRGLSRPFLISLRNTFRQKGRLALTLFNLTLGGAIFISVFNVQLSLNQKIEQTTKYFQADVNLDLKQPYRIQEVQELALSIPGVKDVEAWNFAAAEVLRADDSVSGNLTIIAPPSNTQLISPIMLEGRWLLPNDENALVINEAFWKDNPGLKPGDTLRLKVAGRTRDWVITGVFQYTGMAELFSYTNFETLSSYLKRPGTSASFRLITEDHSPQAQIEIRDLVDQIFRDRGFKVSSVEAGSALVSSIIAYIDILVTFLLIMALLTALVGSMGLAGTLSMNVMERTREIGIMRAIGAHDRIVIKLVIFEGLLISFISFILGAALSFPITTLLSNVVSQAIFNSPANFAFTPAGFLIWLGLAALLAVLASFIPARRASRMTIREVLSYE